MDGPRLPHGRYGVAANTSHGGSRVTDISTIGLDLAKSMFQLHGVNTRGKLVVSKRLRRGSVLTFFANLPRCVVGIEACATAHYWAREIGVWATRCALCRRNT
jgi:hypothetical protein